MKYRFFHTNVAALLIIMLYLPAHAVALDDRTEQDEGTMQEGMTLRGAGEVALGSDYFLGYLRDGKHIVTSPARWDGGDWLVASAVVGTAAGLSLADEEIHGWFQDSRSDTSDSIASIVEPAGDGLAVVPSLGGLCLYGYLADDSRMGRASLLALESYVVSGIITNVIKFSGHRHRPSADDGAYEWDGPGFSGDNLSFPSGHATTAFAVASVFASEYEDTGYVPFIAYSVATLAALSRIHDNQHWASDVFFGSAIGYFTGKTIYSLHTGKRTKLTVIPLLDRDRSVIVLNYRF